MSSHSVNASSNLDMNRLGLWLFLVSDASFFVALISSRFFVYGISTPSEISQALGLGLTVLLLASSLTAYRAEMGASMGDRGMMKRNLILTIGMGLVFLIGVGFEWGVAFSHHETIPSMPYGTILFTLTGIHAFHVLTGLGALLFVYFLKRNAPVGKSEGDYWAIEGAVKWWHLVDLAWVFIYPTVYLLS